MVKILLYIENYNEMAFLQTILKKVSFDVEICKNKASVRDVVITFNPEIIISTARGQKVNGLELVKNFSQRKKKIDFFMVSNSGEDLLKLKEQGLIQGVLKSPINPRDLLSQIADLKNLDVNKMLDKYEKVTQKSQKSDPEEEAASSSAAQDKESDVYRIKGGGEQSSAGMMHLKSETDDGESLTHLKSEVDEGQPLTHLRSEENTEGAPQGITSNPEAENPGEQSFEEGDNFEISEDDITINLINAMSDEKRRKKNQDFLNSVEPLVDKPLSRATVREFNKTLREDPALQESEDLRLLKRQYVEAMLRIKNRNKK